ncbi:hypothetical protein T492DRAFT_839040 [Pavlovales sp. CCMP2436]|nr:hypothetical protein T492DRAFT_839040 [Pavlovales sp. CCMP2436]
MSALSRLLALALPLLAQGWVAPVAHRAAVHGASPHHCAHTAVGETRTLNVRRGARVHAQVLPATPAESESVALESLLAAARVDDPTIVDEAFDRLRHETMVRINQMASEGDKEALWVAKCMEDAMRTRMAAGADKLRTLLAAGEIQRMDALLMKLVRDGGVDSAFSLVLTSNIEHARTSADKTMLQLYTHLYTRIQEELEKRVQPAMGLLHRLLRTTDAGMRERILVDFLVVKTSVTLPGSRFDRLFSV